MTLRKKKALQRKELLPRRKLKLLQEGKRLTRRHWPRDQKTIYDLPFAVSLAMSILARLSCLTKSGRLTSKKAKQEASHNRSVRHISLWTHCKPRRKSSIRTVRLSSMSLVFSSLTRLATSHSPIFV